MIAGLSAMVFACTPDEILNVEDPDIINPENVQSVAGAEAVRLGVLSRFVGMTSGATGQNEGLFLLGGLFTDELINGDSYIARQEIDQRVITPENNFLRDANRQIHRTRVGARQAIELIREYNPSAPGWHLGEMFMVEAYAINILAEHYCDGLILSEIAADGTPTYGEPITTAAAFEQALALVDEGLGEVTGSTGNDARVRGALALLKGRILTNLNRHAEAATAVAGVPTGYEYVHLHSQTTWSSVWWTLHINARRYSVAELEGGNGLDFMSAGDPRVPTCIGGDDACKSIGVTRLDRDDLVRPFNVLMLWPGREDPIAIMKGVDGRMIEAEALLKEGNPTAALAELNEARAAEGLEPLADAGTDAARVNQLFRERAFWQFGRGFRTGDLRRLIRQYGRTQSDVWPVGTFHKGGSFGVDVDIPVPQAEQNNPNVGTSSQTCLSRGA
jgi:hypothetical protein